MLFPAVMGGLHWKNIALITSLFVPGYVLAHHVCDRPSAFISLLLQGGVGCVLCAEPPALGGRVLSSHSLYNPPCAPLPLVWCFSPPHIYWFLPWIQKACELQPVPACGTYPTGEGASLKPRPDRTGMDWTDRKCTRSALEVHRK